MARASLEEIISDAITVTLRQDGLAADYVPNSHRTRPFPDQWERMLNHRVRGYAGNDSRLASTEPDTVLCTYRNGMSEVRTVRSIRRKSRPKSAGKVAVAAVYWHRVRTLGANTELASE